MISVALPAVLSSFSSNQELCHCANTSKWQNMSSLPNRACLKDYNYQRCRKQDSSNNTRIHIHRHPPTDAWVLCAFNSVNWKSMPLPLFLTINTVLTLSLIKQLITGLTCATRTKCVMTPARCWAVGLLSTISWIHWETLLKSMIKRSRIGLSTVQPCLTKLW